MNAQLPISHLLEESNPSLRGGTQQVFVAWIGQELLYLHADKDALVAQVADLAARTNTVSQAK